MDKLGLMLFVVWLVAAGCGHSAGNKAGDAGVEAGTDGILVEVASMVPDAAVPDAVMDAPAVSDAAVTQPDAGMDAPPASDGDIVLSAGSDATIFFPGSMDASDGGTYPQIFALPGTAMVSHTPLFAATPDITFRIPDNGTIEHADLNGDGLSDIVVSKSTALSFYLQQPDGTFQSMRGITLPPKTYYWLYQLADFNGDGRLDVVMDYARTLMVFLQGSDGFADTPDSVVDLTGGVEMGCLQVALFTVQDMNGDGRPDLVAVVRIQTGPLWMAECRYDKILFQVFTQNDNGGFTTFAEFSPRAADTSRMFDVFGLAAGDLDGDGLGDAAILFEGFGLSGYDTWIFSQATGALSPMPVATLQLAQYLKTVRFTDVNGDGRPDVLVRPSPVSPYAFQRDLSQTKIGLSGVFLQQPDGSFETTAHTVQPDGWLPAGLDSKTQPVGIDIRDMDGDGSRDLEGNGQIEGLFRQESGLFGSSPDAELQAIFADEVAASKQLITATFIPSTGASVNTIGKFNRLAYTAVDMDSDGRLDLVSDYAPFAPNRTPDPTTGFYPYDGFAPNTFTEVRIHRQRPLTRRLLTQVLNSRVSVEERVLHIQVTLRNLADRAADNVRVRFVTAPSPFTWSTDLGILRGGVDAMEAFGRDWMTKEENQIKGTPLGPDIVIPRIEVGEEFPLHIAVPVPLVERFDMRCLFVLVDPDQSTNVLLKRRYDFIPE
jgi:hypothetical protein